MAKLICVPLGCSAREQFAAELAREPYGAGVLVLPNRLLMDDVRSRYANVETIGMDTLANKILNANGYINFTEISRRTQELIVQDILEYMKEGEKSKLERVDYRPLSYFGELAKKPGFIKAMTSLVGQLSRSGATEDEIVNILNTWGRSDALGSKDAGVRNVYLMYRQYLKNNDWYDLEGKYRLAIKVLNEKKPKLIWKKIYISDFYSLDNLQIRFLNKLARLCDITIGMCYEKSSDDIDERQRLFAASKLTYLQLVGGELQFDEGKKSKKYNGFCSKEDKKLGQQPKQADLQHLCEALGTSSELVTAKSIHTYRFSKQEAEMRWVLAQVKQLLRRGVQAKSIAVAVRDLSSYSGLRLLADEYGIPVALPLATPLAGQPLTTMLRLLLTSVTDTVDGVDAYFAVLTGGLLPLLADVDLAAAGDLRGEMYFTSRTQAQQKVHELLGKPQGVWQLAEDFIVATPAAASIEEYIADLTSLLDNLQLEQRLGALYKAGRLQLAEVTACLRTRDALKQLLLQLLKDYQSCRSDKNRLQLAEWRSLLNEAVAAEQLVLQHGRQDGVLVTSVVNVQGLSFDYVYIMGLREGEFPKIGNENWIYNDKERGELLRAGLDLPNTALDYAEDAFFFATTVAAARKELYLTWWNEDKEGEASAYIDAVQKLFDNLQAQAAPEQEPASPEELEQYGKAVDSGWLTQQVGAVTLAAAQADDIRTSEREGAYNGVLTAAGMEKQLRKEVGASFTASKLEVYAQCPFRYLGEQLWRQQLLAAKDDLLQPADEGSFLHAVLARFVGGHLQEKLTQYTLSELDDELELAFEDAFKEYEDSAQCVDASMWQAEKPRLWRLLRNWLRFEYADQGRWEGFKPEAVEWDFGTQNGKPLRLALHDRSEVTLKGRIDRIDSDGASVFITDYKRSVALSGKELAAGLDLQLPVYLLAAAGLYAGGSNVSGGCYLLLNKDKRAGKLVLADVGNDDLKPGKNKLPYADNWESFKEFAQNMLTGYIEAIYQGKFIVTEPVNGCSNYCQLKDICRVQQGGAADNDGE